MKIDTEKRDRRVPVLLTATEFRELTLAAEQAGLSLSGYIRNRALETARAHGPRHQVRPDVFT